MEKSIKGSYETVPPPLGVSGESGGITLSYFIMAFKIFSYLMSAICRRRRPTSSSDCTPSGEDSEASLLLCRFQNRPRVLCKLSIRNAVGKELPYPESDPILKLRQPDAFPPGTLETEETERSSTAAMRLQESHAFTF